MDGDGDLDALVAVVAFELEADRLVASDQPEPAAHLARSAVVDLTADHLFVDAPCHGREFPRLAAGPSSRRIIG